MSQIELRPLPPPEQPTPETKTPCNPLPTWLNPSDLIASADISSSQADQDAGKSEHFRLFAVKFSPRTKQKTEEKENVGSEEINITILGERSVLKAIKGAKAETYQQLLRLSPAKSDSGVSRRIGGIATGLSKNSEIVVFNGPTLYRKRQM